MIIFSTIVVFKNMKKILLILALSCLSSQITKAQVITCVPCDMLGMSINVGSSETSISIYHSGQYMTHPQSENIFVWEFTNQQGNILYKDTIVNNSFAILVITGCLLIHLMLPLVK